MKLDLRPYGTDFTVEDIQNALSQLGASSEDITQVYIDDYAEIPDQAFSGWFNLELVYGLYRCVSIGEQAFTYCDKLVNDDISCCETIGPSAFDHCVSLLTMRIKPGVAIPTACFYQCSSLHLVYNLNQCTSIGESAFNECHALANADVSRANTIGGFAFRECTSLVTIRIKPGISLGMNVFEGCTNLELVYNLNQCTAIGDEAGAFMGCSKLRNTSIENCDEVPAFAFTGCTSLPSIKLKPHTAIRSYAFDRCTSLSKVYNLNTAQYIGEYAFLSCSSLDQTLDLWSLSAGNLCQGAFLGAGARPFHVKFSNLPGNGQSPFRLGDYFDTSKIQYVTIPSYLFSIPSCFASDCSNLELVYNLCYVSGGIGNTAFCNCTKLSNSKLNVNRHSNGIIEEYAFMNCESVQFSDIACSAIGSHAFDGCVGMNALSIVAFNGGIGSYAFANCTGLTKVDARTRSFNSEWSDGTFEFHEGAFSGCTNLSTVWLDSCVTSLGSSCFADCTSLETVYNLAQVGEGAPSCYLGEDIFRNDEVLSNHRLGIGPNASVDYSAFANCGPFEWNLYNASTSTFPLVEWDVRRGTKFKCTDGTYIAEPALTTFTMQDGTSEEYDIVGTLDKQWMIDNGFMNDGGTWLKSVRTVDIGSHATGIGDYAFQNCSTLRKVILPTTVLSIGNQSFNSSGVTEVEFSEGLQSLDYGAFVFCRGLQHVVLPDSVTTIGQGAFNFCNQIIDITVGSGVQTIAINAFANTPKLESLTFKGKTLAEVQAMSNYSSWGVDASKINVA